MRARSGSDPATQVCRNASSGLLSRQEVVLLLALVLYSLIPVLGGLLRAVELMGPSLGLPVNPRAEVAPFPIIVHIISSAVFCLGGALQFAPGIRRRRPVGHRVLGWIVLLSGVAAAGSGVWMTHYYSFPQELQGRALYIARIAVGSLMLMFLCWSMRANRSRQFLRHGAMMLRAYALGQGASTQTFFGLGLMLMLGTELIGPARDAMMVAAWVFNAICAEAIIIRYFRRSAVTSSRPQPEAQPAKHREYHAS